MISSMDMRKLTLLVERGTEDMSRIEMGVFVVVEWERWIQLERIEVGVVRVDVHVRMALQPPALRWQRDRRWVDRGQ